MTEDEIRQQLVNYAQLAYSRHLVRGSGGNFSARLDSSRMLITSTGVSLGDTTPENLVEVEIATYATGSTNSYRPSKEYRYHADILRLRPEISAVLHVHPPNVTAFAVKKRDIPMLTDAAFKQRPIPRVSFAPSGSDALQQLVAGAVASNSGCMALLLEEHGLVTFGTTVVSAFYLADLIEELAHIARIAAAMP